MARARKSEPRIEERVKVTVKLPRDLVLAGKMHALRHGTHLQDLLERGLRDQLKGAR
ncbi:MAG: hypothetical protein ACREM3_15235 [Candidatus Rokuibacteriota bacterium]